MKASKSLARWQVLVLLLIVGLLLTGCGVRHGVSWPSLDLVTVDGQDLVLVTYNTQVDLIDPYVVGFDTERRFNLATADTANSFWQVNGSNYNGNQFYASPFASSENDRDTATFPVYSNDSFRLLEIYLDSAQAVNTAGSPLTDAVIADTVQGDGLIYVGYRQKDLVALNSETLVEEWRLTTSAGIWAAPLLHDGVLYVPSVDHNLYAVNASSGEVLWQLGLEGAITATPLVYEDALYLGSFSHKLFKISLSGEILTSFEGANWIWSTPVVDANGVLYYGDLSGFVYALNASDLSVVWQSQPTERGIRPAPILVNDFVVVASRDSFVYWLSQSNGQTVQKAEFTGPVEILSDMLYLPADEANNRPPLLLVASTDTGKLVTAYNLETFTPQWVYHR